MKRLFDLVFVLALLSAPTLVVGQTLPTATASCNPKNPSHISGDVAFRLSQEAKDNDSVDCFTYVAAVQGNATAEAYWASYLYDHQANDEAPIMPCYMVWTFSCSGADIKNITMLSRFRGLSHLRPAGLLSGSNSGPCLGRENALLRRDGSRRGLCFGPSFCLSGGGCGCTGENALHLFETSDFRVYLCNDFCGIHRSILRRHSLICDRPTCQESSHS
jgi:hypothetical protein